MPAKILLLFMTLMACCERPNGQPARLTLTEPHIEVNKSKRQLRLFDGERLVKTYRVGLGFNPVGMKLREGDGATPEGHYFICEKNPKSRFHLSLGISYPGPLDAERGLRSGLITQAQHDEIVRAHRERRTPPWKTALGGEIFIHGNGGKSDWTLGCVAVEDDEVEELFRLVPVGTLVKIVP
jgi:murein L,D-transpeptidase YafK